jgi:polar amino acid transport system substrate-binding protein
MKHKFFKRCLPCRSPLSRVLRAGLVLGAVCCLVLALGSCGGQTETERVTHSDLPVILVGSDNYPPFHYEDANGQPTGIDVDLAKEAFRRMGYQAVFVTIDWEDKKDLVERGEIDCIWGSFSSDGREDQYLWTEPYLYSRQVVAVRQDSDIQTLADLAGKRVAVQSTTKPEELFLAHTDPRIPRVAEVFSLQDRELIYPYLSKGYADALAAHETAILQCMSDYSLDYRILDEPLLTVGLGVAFARTDQRGLDKELSRTFEEMRADGSLEQIVGRYLDEPQRLLEVTP